MSGPPATEGKWAGMSIGHRIATLFRVKANKALDSAEDPREVLDYSYEQQLEMVQEVAAACGVATSRSASNCSSPSQLSAGKLQGQAQQALAAGREKLRPGGLIRPAAVTAQISDLQGPGVAAGGGGQTDLTSQRLRRRSMRP